MDEFEKQNDAMDARITFLMEAATIIAGGLAARGLLGDGPVDALYVALERLEAVGADNANHSRALRAQLGEAML